MGGFSIRYQPTSDSTVYSVVCKILMALTGWTGGTGIIDLITTISGGGSPVETLGNVTIASAATAQLAIPSGKSGYISVPSAQDGSIFVGGSNVTNASGGFRGVELIAGGISPKLTGPVWVAASANGLVAGVVTA